MFAVTWLGLVATLNAGLQPFSFTEAKRFSDKAACEAHVAKYQDRAPDMVRGLLNGDWTVEVAVKGKCDAAGTPA